MQLLIDGRETVRGRGVPEAARRAVDDLLERTINQIEIKWSPGALSSLHIYRGAKNGEIFVFRHDNARQRAYQLVGQIDPALLNDVLEASLSRSKKGLLRYRWRPSRPRRRVPTHVYSSIAAIVLAGVILWSYVESPYIALAVFFGGALDALQSLVFPTKARRTRLLRGYRYGIKSLWFDVLGFLRFTYCFGVASVHARFPQFWLGLSIIGLLIAVLLILALRSGIPDKTPRVRRLRDGSGIVQGSGRFKPIVVRVTFLALWVFCWQAYILAQVSDAGA
jgi:hypothetical protein